MKKVEASSKTVSGEKLRGKKAEIEPQKNLSQIAADNKAFGLPSHHGSSCLDELYGLRLCFTAKNQNQLESVDPI